MNQAYYEGEESQINNEHIISPDENDTTSSSSSNEQIQNNNNNNNKNNIDNTIDEPDIKIIIIGDSAVGKSKLLERYLINDYNPRRLSTHALTLYRKNVTLGNNNNNNNNNNSSNNSSNRNEEETIKVDFWDTAGQEKFHSLHPTYYYRAHACILVFDVTRKSTYHNLQKWYDELLQYSSNYLGRSTTTTTTTIPCILVANKVDINYDVTKKSFKFASDHHMPFFFVSSADGTNVVKVFEEAICMALGQKRYGERDFLSECLELLDDGPLKLNE